MRIFYYDKTFEGLLSAVFDAYTLKVFPQRLLLPGDIPPLMTKAPHTVVTRPEKGRRVFTALEKKLSLFALSDLLYVNLSESPGGDELLFRYIRKVFDTPQSIEKNLADPDVLAVTQLAHKVGRERQHWLGFVRFQKTAEGIYFAPVAPRYNVLPLMVRHFKDRFADQHWIIYDTQRQYGVYFDLRECREISLDEKHLQGGEPAAHLLGDNEALFKRLWQSYFTAASIKERTNSKLQRRCMPQRFWKYLPEKPGEPQT